MIRSKGVDLRNFYSPESSFGGFSRHDAMIEFYTRISGIIEPNYRILDYGAGRGAQISEDKIPYRRHLKIFKGRVAQLEGCDIDPIVMDNPYLDTATILEEGKPLPYSDNYFDLIYSNWVFEHIEKPELAASELLRITKPGGFICALTPNKWGYISIAARLISNKRHASLLRSIQPSRKELDIFPTLYRLNSTSEIKKHFLSNENNVVVYTLHGDPAYHFNNRFVYKFFEIAHSLSPSFLQPLLIALIEKRSIAKKNTTLNPASIS